MYESVRASLVTRPVHAVCVPSNPAEVHRLEAVPGEATDGGAHPAPGVRQAGASGGASRAPVPGHHPRGGGQDVRVRDEGRRGAGDDLRPAEARLRRQ